MAITAEGPGAYWFIEISTKLPEPRCSFKPTEPLKWVIRISKTDILRQRLIKFSDFSFFKETCIADDVQSQLQNWSVKEMQQNHEIHNIGYDATTSGWWYSHGKWRVMLKVIYIVIPNSSSSEVQVQFTVNKADQDEQNKWISARYLTPSEEQLNMQQVPVHPPQENQAVCLQKIESIFWTSPHR